MVSLDLKSLTNQITQPSILIRTSNFDGQF